MMPGHTARITQLAFGSKDILASADEGGNVWLMHTTSGAVRQVPTAALWPNNEPPKAITWLRWLKDNQALLFANAPSARDGIDTAFQVNVRRLIIDRWTPLGRTPGFGDWVTANKAAHSQPQ